MDHWMYLEASHDGDTGLKPIMCYPVYSKGLGRPGYCVPCVLSSDVLSYWTVKGVGLKVRLFLRRWLLSSSSIDAQNRLCSIAIGYSKVSQPAPMPLPPQSVLSASIANIVYL